MGNYFIYSHEALPNPEMMGKPRYTPDGSWIKYAGVTLPALPAKTWVELEEDDPRYATIRRRDWRDRQPDAVEVPLRRFMPVVKNQFAERGVVMLDHKPSQAEQQAISVACEEVNLKFRKKAIEDFENQREMAKARQGTYDPTPYIDECYDVLHMKKPYSLEALKAHRDPGAEAANRIADAIAGALRSDRKEREDAAMKVAEQLVTVPEPQQPRVPAARR